MNVYNSKWVMWFKQGDSLNWAITLGQITFFSESKDKVGPSWHRHEDCHKKQWRKYWYIGFAIMYLYYLARYGYKNNLFEVEARGCE